MTVSHNHIVFFTRRHVKKENGNEIYYDYTNGYKVVGAGQDGKLLAEWEKRMMTKKTVN